MISTASYAQTGKQNPDTVRCYTLTELQYIAATLVEARACDTLLAISNVRVANRDSMITEKSYEIDQLNKQLSIKDQIIEIKDTEIMRLATELEKSERKRRWLKLGWASTSVILGALTVYFILT